MQNNIIPALQGPMFYQLVDLETAFSLTYEYLNTKATDLLN